MLQSVAEGPGLAKRLQGLTKPVVELEEGLLVSATYDGKTGKAVLKFYDSASERVWLWEDDSGHRPYCYTKLTREELAEKGVAVGKNGILASSTNAATPGTGTGIGTVSVDTSLGGTVIGTGGAGSFGIGAITDKGSIIISTQDVSDAGGSAISALIGTPPCCTSRMALNTCSGAARFKRYPEAPARSALKMRSGSS